MERFGETADGREVHLVRIAGGRLDAEVLTFGAAIRSLRLDGWPHPLSLGFPSVADYERVGGHVGRVPGRFANRIAGGRFKLDGKPVQLATNEGPNTLHGGPNGFGNRVWQVAEVASDRVRLELVSPADDEGFPGRLAASVTYAVEAPSALAMTFEATTDAPTICNLTQHSYFNFDNSASIDGHSVQVAARAYLPVDAASLPLGAPAPVAGTRFDLSTPTRLEGLRLDYNYCLAAARRATPADVATVSVPGLSMTVATTEPGLQVYTGDNLVSHPPPRAGVCLEPQLWPDAPNHPDYPQPVLRPGERYRHETRLTFRRSGDVAGGRAQTPDA